MSHSAVCPYSCTDEAVVGAFKGAFAGSLWGAYSFHRNLLAVRPTPSVPLAPTMATTLHSSTQSATVANTPLAALSTSARLKVSSALAPTLTALIDVLLRLSDRHPSAVLAADRRECSPAVLLCQLLSPLLVYPVKFASLYSLYRFFSCATCYLAPTPPNPNSLLTPLLHSTFSASLAGLVTSLPHLSLRTSLAHVVGCGGLGAVAVVAQVGVGWVGEAVGSAVRSRRVAADRRGEEG